MIDRPVGGGSLCHRARPGSVNGPAVPRPTSRRSRGPLVLMALGLGLVTMIGSAAVLWLAADVLTRVPAHDEPPMADVVELMKVALAVGLSKWAAAL